MRKPKTMPERLRAITPAEIPGWREDDLAPALAAFQRSAIEILQTGHGFKRPAHFGGLKEEWLMVCDLALKASDPRTFFESQFQALEVSDTERPEGLFTGYYEPEAEGALAPSADFPVPIYARPDDLVAFAEDEAKATGLGYGRRVNGQPMPYFTRREIEGGALAGRGLEICFLKSWVDAFFIQVQGNGRVRLPDGQIIRLSYAAKNGRPYTGIGSVLLARGVGTRQTMSMQLLRQWMQDHPEEMRQLLWCNESFVFFRPTEISDSALGAIGAAKVNLTPLRSLAVDRTYWMFGTPLFVGTHEPPEAHGGARPFRHLMIAQDTGTAIRGLVRGDVYWGWGKNAALNAGHMKSPGSMVALLPKAVAKGLLP
ncbi:MAG: MltA domain-containing protein [Alphaproteobacteria bacterium]|nr:MltA domain-containing protein [Alphaproteobacteria bacterium]